MCIFFYYGLTSLCDPMIDTLVYVCMYVNTTLVSVVGESSLASEWWENVDRRYKNRDYNTEVFRDKSWEWWENEMVKVEKRMSNDVTRTGDATPKCLETRVGSGEKWSSRSRKVSQVDWWSLSFSRFDLHSSFSTNLAFKPLSSFFFIDGVFTWRYKFLVIYM